MQEITLINPDSEFLYQPRVMPPLGLLYIVSSLKEYGVKVNLIDLAGELDAELGARIPATRLYGLTATTPQFPQAITIAQKLKKKFSDIRVCLGGVHATLRPRECLEAGFDAVIVGEGELAIKDFLDGGSGIIKHDISDLDDISFPDRSLVADYDYTIDGKRAATIMTTRGNCPYRCSFCCQPWQHGLRLRSWENVMKELEEIKGLGYEAIMFYDDEVGIKVERDKKIFEGLCSLDLIWRAFTRANLVSASKAQFMFATGCREVLIGMESGSDIILQNVNKGTTVQQNAEAAKALYNAGIRVKAAVIIGLPGESKKTLEETWSFCEKIERYVAIYDFTVFVPYPGSPIFEYPERFDIRFDKRDVYVPYKGGEWQSIASTSHLAREEITEWRRKFHQRFLGIEGEKYL